MHVWDHDAIAKQVVPSGNDHQSLIVLSFAFKDDLDAKGGKPKDKNKKDDQPQNEQQIKQPYHLPLFGIFGRKAGLYTFDLTISSDPSFYMEPAPLEYRRMIDKISSGSSA